MAGGTILLALAVAAMPHAGNARATASAGVTIIAGEQVHFEAVPKSRTEKRMAKAQRRAAKGQVLVEFY